MKKIYLFLAVFLLSMASIKAQNWVTWGPNTALGNLSLGVYAIAVSPYDGSIYAGGTFTGAVNYLAKYDPSSNSWQSVGVGVSGPVYALTFFKNNLYIGGLFANAGGVQVNNIASLSSTGTYSSVGVGLNEQVSCFSVAPDSSVLYVGGKFSSDYPGSTSLLHIAKWNLSSWSAVGNGITGVVNTIVTHNSKLYAGTENVSSPVYELNSNVWSNTAGLSGGRVRALASYNGYLYAGGEFDSPSRTVARYNGSWGTAITNFPIGTKVYSFHKFGNALYVGGLFSAIGIPGYLATNVGKFVNNDPLRQVLATNYPDNAPYCLASGSGYLYAGGLFKASGENVIRTSSTISVDEINDLIETSSFYPNPLSTSSNLNVKLKSHANSAQLSILDAQGKIVQEQMISELINNEINFKIDRNDLATGIYHYQLTIDGQSAASSSFVIE